MKILLIYPSYAKLIEGHSELSHLTDGYPWLDPVGPGLALPTLAALTPKEIELEFIDDQFMSIPYETNANLVAISLFTPQASRAYDIADNFRQRNKLVILGGKHVTIMPQEARAHADILFIGEAELTWPLFINDLLHGTTKQFYISERPPTINEIPLPQRSLVNRQTYPHDMEIMLTPRSCRLQCQWCPIAHVEPLVDGKIRQLTADKILQDLTNVASNTLYIPDNLTQGATGDNALPMLRELFAALSTTQKRFMLALAPDELSSIKQVDPSFLKHLHSCNVDSLYLTLNSFATNIPSELAQKYWNNHDLIKYIQDLGFHICASTMLGFDYDQPSIFDTVLAYLTRLSINDAVFFIATPFPGSRLFARFTKSGRLLHHQWQKYNGANIVFRPKHFSVEQLRQGWLDCWNWFLTNHGEAMRKRYIKS
ncbi:MAG: cobalamin-dependent protein [Deltaproteobacteria bacterium]|nr:cobalamin-dependent protein [Deltaproteobacteria bacterium]